MIEKRISNKYILNRYALFKKIKTNYKLHSSYFEEPIDSVYLKKIIYRAYIKKDSDSNFSLEIPITSFSLNSNKENEIKYTHTQQVKIPLPENLTTEMDVIKARTLNNSVRDEVIQIEREMHKSDDSIIVDVVSRAYIQSLRFNVDSNNNVGIVDSEIELKELPNSFQSPRNLDIKHIFSYQSNSDGSMQFIISEKDIVMPFDIFKINGINYTCNSSSITVNNYKTTNTITGI